MKYNSVIKYLLVGLMAVAFASCQKENLETTITEEEEITQTVNCDAWQMSIIDDGNGVLSPESQGGTAPFLYQWSTGDTIEIITVNTAGDYGLTITDAEGCTVDAQITIDIEDPCNGLSVQIIETTDTVLVLNAIVSGGSAPFVYEWTTGETTSSITPTSSGTYGVIVIDAQGCTYEVLSAIQIADPCNGLNVEIAETIDTAHVLAAIVNGGNAPFSYQWSTGETTSTISPSGDGIYEVLVIDALGCTYETQIVVSDSNNSPCQDFTMTIAEQPPGSGDIYTSVSGGTPAYTYFWSTGETTSNISINSSGVYSVSITDSNGCILAGSIQL